MITPFVQNAGPGGYRRWSMDHKNGGFKSSDGLHHDFLLNVLFLGVIPHRKMWPSETMKSDNAQKAAIISGYGGPLCRSADNVNGNPGPSFNNLVDISPSQYRVTITNNFSCASCPFKEYSNSRPVCKLSYLVPFVFSDDLNTVNIVEFSQSSVAVVKPIFESMYKNPEQFGKFYNVTSMLSERNGVVFAKADIVLKTNYDEYMKDIARLHTLFSEASKSIMDEYNKFTAKANNVTSSDPVRVVGHGHS